jgi:polyferredoxin
MNNSKCGDCMVCMDACPERAVSGKLWEVGLYRDHFFDPVKCRKTAWTASAIFALSGGSATLIMMKYGASLKRRSRTKRPRT